MYFHQLQITDKHTKELPVEQQNAPGDNYARWRMDLLSKSSNCKLTFFGIFFKN
jgi:hypothetical protein